MSNIPQVVIVGGGAGGLELAKRLGQAYGKRQMDIVLVDRSTTHIWKPLLHEVATGALDANADEVNYGGHSHEWNYRFVYGAFQGLDRASRTIHIEPLVDEEGHEIAPRRVIGYDCLILAFGSVTNSFQTPGVSEHCYFLDERKQADAFRNHLLKECLRVSRRKPDPTTEPAKLRISIVGGGATGVELAAELCSSAQNLEFYGLEMFERNSLEVTLIEAGSRILPALPEDLARSAALELEKLGVRLLTDTAVVSANAAGMQTKDGTWIPANIQVWAAGVKGASIDGGLDNLELSKNGQIVVRSTLQSSIDDRIFALGDCAFYLPAGENRPVPPRAQAAHQMASAVFFNLGRTIKGRPLKDFVYKDHGSLVSLSRYSTFGTLMGNLTTGTMTIRGRLARAAYMSLYRMHLLAIHGWLKGSLLILAGRLGKLARPSMKMH